MVSDGIVLELRECGHNGIIEGLLKACKRVTDGIVEELMRV